MGPYLEFVPVGGTKVAQNGVHLGCSAGTLQQLEVELARLLGIGASIVWEERFPDDVGARYRNVGSVRLRAMSSASAAVRFTRRPEGAKPTPCVAWGVPRSLYGTADVR